MVKSSCTPPPVPARPTYFLQPIGGGPETQLALPGEQRDPSISGNLIAFESEVPTSTWPEYDIFVYDLNTGNLFQVTNTPVNETLNDITVCGGVGRIVFGAPSAEYNVLAFTFQVPSSSSG